VAQTGTGKTAAFSLPIIQLLVKGEGKRKPKTARSLILAPTRELAVQIEENIRGYAKYLHYKIGLVFGGVSQKAQVKMMAPGVDILIATPGRLIDLMNQGQLKLNEVEYFVLDEADRMLDMGFIRDINKIVAALPKKRQTLFFSATMQHTVVGLAKTILTNPDRVEIAPAATTAEKVDQYVLYVPKNQKNKLLAHVLKDPTIEKAIIFTRTKHGANRVSKKLDQLGISSSAIHGNKSQNARQAALNQFRDGEIRTLVATDVAARGIDVDDITHVINFDLPNEEDSYVHRIGRTARAGKTGISLSFCDHEERKYLKDIERLIRQKITIKDDHPFHIEGIQPADNTKDDDGDDDKDRRPRRPRNRGRNNKRRNQSYKKPAKSNNPARSRRPAKEGNTAEPNNKNKRRRPPRKSR
jgi:ATP-dependent RNA helicase RhlE